MESKTHIAALDSTNNTNVPDVCLVSTHLLPVCVHVTMHIIWSRMSKPSEILKMLFSQPHTISSWNCICMSFYTVSWTYCCFIAHTTFDHMLVDLALNADKRLTHTAADYRGIATLRWCQRWVWWRILTQKHRGLSWTWKRRETWGTDI